MKSSHVTIWLALMPNLSNTSRLYMTHPGITSGIPPQTLPLNSA